MSDGEPIVQVRQANEIGFVQLNRPRQANAINSALASAVLEAVESLVRDPSVRAIVIAASGKHFSAGADLKAVAQQRLEGDPNPVARLCDGIAGIALPTIACIQGAAIGGGCELALACDFRIMSSAASISLPEIRFGMLPAAGGTQRLPRLIGPAAAKRMIFTGDPVPAAECLRTGLVDQVADADLLDAAVEQFVSRFSDKAAYALAAAKKLIDEAVDAPLKDRLIVEAETIATMATPEQRQAERARAQQASGVYNKLFG